jgi:hypothetical protein
MRIATMSTNIKTTISMDSRLEEEPSPDWAKAGIANTNDKNITSALFIHLVFILENSISIYILCLQISFGSFCIIVKRQTFHFFYILLIQK